MTSLAPGGRCAKVAIVGSGPSGFYAAEALLEAYSEIEVSFIERLPAPFGLARYGVAPDHPKLKQPIAIYEGILRSPKVHFFGNVEAGGDITVEQLLELYHAVILAYGAEADARLDIPGESLQGSYTATEFVGWYNGHPDYRDRCFDFSHDTAVVIGNGNVALDIARMLAKTTGELGKTDIAAHAITALAESRVRRIYVIGRRGPAQAKFSPQELQEFTKLSDCTAHIDAIYLNLNDASKLEISDKRSRGIAKNMEIFSGFGAPGAADKSRCCQFHFLQSPVEFTGTDRVRGLRLMENRLKGDPFAQVAEPTGIVSEISCGLVFRSVGFRGLPISDLPFDRDRGVLYTKHGRVLDDHGDVIPRIYAAGWIKRGPSGTIGTNRGDSVETVNSLTIDLDHFLNFHRPGASGLRRLLHEVGKQVVTYADWVVIDRAELHSGRINGKPREKLTRIGDMLRVINMEPLPAKACEYAGPRHGC